MIVCLHYLSKGGLLGDPARADMTATGYTAWFVEALCLVAVNVYVLISGYFGVDLLGSQTVGKRLSVYHEQTQPLIDFYQQKGILRTVDGTREMEEVFAEIRAILD